MAAPNRPVPLPWACTILSIFLGFLLTGPHSVKAVDGVELPPVLLQMMRNDTVFKQLGLDEAEIRKVTDVLDRVDGEWWRSRNMQDAERNETVNRLSAKVKDELRGILSKESFSRLEQLERQALGPRMFLLADVAEQLSLSPVTVEKMASIALETNVSTTSLNKRLQDGGDASEIESEQKALVAKEQEAIVGLLTNGQKLRIRGLTGEPFDFGRVTRTLPRAPELIQTPQNWLQGSASSLEQLRGSVVAVHFYAFQCINCQRNLPHYQAWHQDYSDKGLVVIGIQTPETSAERNAEQVKAAIKSSGIGYPILMDPESKNWESWGTTMWPTVYLLDRDGYIRAWWQGEMNWQGNPGEKKMRAHIERLLAE